MIRALKPIKRKDHRTLDWHKTFGTAPILGDFNFDKVKVFPNQSAEGHPQACTSYTVTGTASNDDSVDYNDKLFTYENTKRMMGVSGEVPVDQMTAMKSASIYGVKRKEQNTQDALNQRRAPYFIVKKLGDYFDGLVSAMQIKQGTLNVGSYWPLEAERVGSDGIVPTFEVPQDWSTGHNYEVCGIKGDKLIIKSWQGGNFGDHGYIYFSRKQINDLLGSKGAGAFGQKHATPEEIRRVEMGLLEYLLSLLRTLLERVLRQSPTSAPIVEPVPPQLQPEPIPSPSIPSKYLWDNPANVRHSVRVICDEEGLDVAHKNTLCATIACESGFNPQAINKNTDSHKSTDWGLCQINDYYHIGQGKSFPSSQFVMDNPEMCVRWMCKMWKANKQTLWICYSSGKFAKYL